MTNARTSLEHHTSAAGRLDQAAQHHHGASKLFERDHAYAARLVQIATAIRSGVRSTDDNEARSGPVGDRGGRQDHGRHRHATADRRDRPIGKREVAAWTRAPALASASQTSDRSSRRRLSLPVRGDDAILERMSGAARRTRAKGCCEVRSGPIAIHLPY
jgi:hypothetical protein